MGGGGGHIPNENVGDARFLVLGGVNQVSLIHLSMVFDSLGDQAYL